MEREAKNYISRRQFGEASVTVIDEASGLWPLELVGPDGEPIVNVPGTDAKGRALIGFHVVHIQTHDASILVDSGLDDPDTAWGREFEANWRSVRRTPGLKAGLAHIGVTPSDITHVLITHAHFDHIAGLTVERDGVQVPRFANATVFLGRGDWENNPERDTPGSEAAVRLGCIERHGLLHLVDADETIAPEVTMIPSPGESPGHCIVRVSSQGETFYALGDLFHHTAEVEHLDWVAPWVDRPSMLRSREKLLVEAKQTSATLAYTHHVFPPWGSVAETDGAWQWQES